ncbi:hypothetical protein Y032_0017g3469 [Ancylostoma ceylanicum]|uniref:Uncharacterized protein n=1 Tax=Ancylostoma ceylanicum TaxID=53326 RepID=A0A016V6L4_9BILA|nr:hypothetical protein Y032_0017g3469 [Ancylostoma ceylanicum]
MDEFNWMAEWIKISENGYIPAVFSLPMSNILDTAPGNTSSIFTSARSTLMLITTSSQPSLRQLHIVRF